MKTATRFCYVPFYWKSWRSIICTFCGPSSVACFELRRHPTATAVVPKPPEDRLLISGRGRFRQQGLTSLQYLRISFNNLVGVLPPSLFNISSIDYFNVAANRLEGALPPDMGITLPNLQLLILAGNRFSGPFPASLMNASKLQSIDISDNSITGLVPLDLGQLSRLFRISMPLNRLGSGKAGDPNFLPSLANCSGLQTLDFANNGFGGELPDSIQNAFINSVH